MDGDNALSIDGLDPVGRMGARLDGVGNSIVTAAIAPLPLVWDSHFHFF